MLLEWLDDNDAGETLEKLHSCSLEALHGQLKKMTANELGLLLLDCVMDEGRRRRSLDTHGHPASE